MKLNKLKNIFIIKTFSCAIDTINNSINAIIACL